MRAKPLPLYSTADRRDPVLIINPTAGRGQAGKQVHAIAQRLRESGFLNCVWHYTQASGDAERLARAAAQDGASLVVAVGGDGTVHEVVNGILGTSATLGIIPYGTGNDFARALGLHGSLAAACGALAQGETRRVDVGTIEGLGTGGPRRFLVLTGTGFDAQTARTVNEGINYLSGAPAYVWGAILTARKFMPFRLSLTLDDIQTIETPAMFVSVANTEMTGGGMKIAPGAQPDDGLLDICLVRETSKKDLLWQLTKVFDGRHVDHPAVTMLRASRITLNADPPQPLLIDGEVCGTTPAAITIERQALPVKALPV